MLAPRERPEPHLAELPTFIYELLQPPATSSRGLELPLYTETVEGLQTLSTPEKVLAGNLGASTEAIM